MKNFILFTIFFSGISPLAFNQSIISLNSNDIPVQFERNSSLSPNSSANISEWYNYGQAIYDMGGDVNYFRNFLFPDSTVQVEFSSGLGYVWKHSLGQVLDPTSAYFASSNTLLDSTVSYTLDSVGFYYRYFRFQDSVPDTIIVQIFEDNKITFAPDPWGNGKSYARVAYNYIKRKGSFPSYEYIRLLTDSDTATTSQGFLAFPVNISVPAGKKVAATITYFPGHSFNPGDTIDAYLSPPPVKQMNAFVAYDFRDNDKNLDTYFYNNELTSTKSVRYNADTNGWNGKYIPGTAWNDGIYHLDMAFKITTLNLGEDDASPVGNKYCIYPNLVKAGDKIFILVNNELTSEIKKINYYDLAGRKIFSDKANFSNGSKDKSFQIPAFESGMYIVSLETKNGNFSSKIIVQ